VTEKKASLREVDLKCQMFVIEVGLGKISLARSTVECDLTFLQSLLKLAIKQSKSLPPSPQGLSSALTSNLDAIHIILFENLPRGALVDVVVA
jgi:hypothetical protein